MKISAQHFLRQNPVHHQHYNTDFGLDFVILIIQLLSSLTFYSSLTFVECRSSILSSTWSADNNDINIDNITCPTQCECSFNPSKWVNETFRTVDCSLKGLKRLSRASLAKSTQSLWLSGNRVDLYSLLTLSNHHVHQHQPFDHLIELDLSNNSIVSLGRSSAHPFLSLAHLKHLNLSNNSIRTLYPGIFRGLKRLKILAINGGQLKYIYEHAFDGLENLEQLYLRENKIGSIFIELFQNIANLHILDLDGNSLTHLTGGIFASLNNLRQLSICRNHLHDLDDNSLVGLDMLETINLCDNQLTKVPSIALQSLKRVKHINLSGNQLLTLTTGDFVHLPVQMIVINNCSQLTGIERMAFWDLPDLLQLTITSNKRLQFIDNQAFSGTPRLHQLQLDDNALLILDGDMINNIIDQRPSLASPLSSSPVSSSSSTMVNHHYHHHNHRKVQYHHHQQQQQQHYHQNNQQQHQQQPQLIVSLTSNPLLCDCNINYLYQCLIAVNRSKVLIVNSDQLTCSYNDTTTMTIKNLDVNKIPSECVPTIISTGKVSPLPMENKSSSVPNESIASNLIVINGSIGDKINLNCRAIGVPMPTIMWILPTGNVVSNDTALINSHIQLIKSTNQLRINHLRSTDSGLYRCIAENRKGSTELTYKVTVEHLKVQIWPLGVSSTFVLLTWNGTTKWSTDQHQHRSQNLIPSSTSSASPSSLASASLPEYQILYKNEDNPNDRFESISVGHYLRSYTINHLEPRKRYKLCIAVRDYETHGNYIQLSCTIVKTTSDSSLLSSSTYSSSSSSSSSLSSTGSIIDHSSSSSLLSSSFLHDSMKDTSSYVAVTLTFSLTALAIMAIVFTVVGARKAFIVVNRQQFVPSRQFETPEKCLVSNMAPIPLTHIPLDQEI